MVDGSKGLSSLKGLRQTALAGAGVIAGLTLFLTAYSAAFADPRPRSIPVAVAAQAPLVAQMERSPALAVRRVAGLPQIRTLIERRTVYGGLVALDGRKQQLDVASGGGRSVAEALLTLAGAEAARNGARLGVVDLAPLRASDASGAVEFYCVIFLSLAACLGAMVVARLLGELAGAGDFARRVAFLAGYAVALAAVFTAVADAGFGALTGQPGWLLLVFFAYAMAVGLAITGLAARFGTKVPLAVIVTMVVLGDTSAGGPVGRPLLDAFFSALTPVFPQGAGLSMVRGAVYFAGAGVAVAAATLAVWGGVGVLLLASAALRRRPSLASPAPADDAGLQTAITGACHGESRTDGDVSR